LTLLSNAPTCSWSTGTLLRWAVEKGDEAVVKLLLAKDGVVDADGVDFGWWAKSARRARLSLAD